MKVELLSPLKVQDEQPENTWRILDNFNVTITEDDETVTDISVPAGFITDFASVPRLPIIFEAFGDIAHKAATLHDYLYSVAKKPRSWCDNVFLGALLATGVPEDKAQLMYLAVRVFGRSHYGWIPDLPDKRDIIYKVERQVHTPPMVDLRPLCPPVYDQGQLGSCTAQAIAAAIQMDRKKQHFTPDFIPSRLFIYYNERAMEGTISSDSGAMIRDGIKSVAKLGVCPSTLWNYTIKDFMVTPPQVCYKQALKYHVVQYYRIEQNRNAFRQCLAQGYPFVFGFSVYESFESLQVEKTGIVQLPAENEQQLGGHAVIAVGYDDQKGVVIVRNSWGPDWGQQGYFTLPYAYLEDKNLADDIWTIRLIAA